jgi:hypothetical protein
MALVVSAIANRTSGIMGVCAFVVLQLAVLACCCCCQLQQAQRTMPASLRMLVVVLHLLLLLLLLLLLQRTCKPSVPVGIWYVPGQMFGLLGLSCNAALGICSSQHHRSIHWLLSS